jgi:hypothetical protein
MNSFVLVPNKISELELWILITVFDMSKSFVLIYLVVVSLIFFLLLVILLLLAFNKLAFEAFNRGEEVDAVGAENCKFLIVHWVELYLLVLLRLARELNIWLNCQLLILFDIKYGDPEVRNAANHKQVAAISREHHIQHLDSCVRLEPCY